MESNGKELVLALMGSDSDWDVMKATVETLGEYGINARVHITSAHRTPERTKEIIAQAERDGIKVIVAAAGMAAHLAGAVAAATPLPVIGVPLESGGLGGLDALLSTVQMPPGVPVATMAIGKPGAKNAAHFAAQTLALTDETIAKSVRDFREAQKNSVIEKDKKLQTKRS